MVKDKIKRCFLLNLPGEQKKLFDELIDLGFKVAKAMVRYFCLHHEELIGLDEIVSEFGYRNEIAAARAMNTVFTYLNAPFLKASEKQKQGAKTLEKRVSRERMRKAIKEEFTPEKERRIINILKQVMETNLQPGAETDALLSPEISSLLEEIAGYKDKTSKGKKMAIKQLFLKLLGDPSKKELLNELINFNILCAKITKRYFCLDGEEFISQAGLAQEYCKSQTNISTLILVVLKYLCPQFKVIKRVKSAANTLKKTVADLRKEKIFPSEKFPKKISKPFFYLLYEKVLFAHKRGFIETLGSWKPMEAEILRLRFNLDKQCDRCLERPEIAKILGLKSQQMAEQLEKTALYWIGINDKPS